MSSSVQDTPVAVEDHPTGPIRPVPFVVAPEQGLRVLRTSSTAWLWFVGCHGGAGESTLANLLSGAAAGEHRWPVRVDGEIPYVVLVARTSYTGIMAARTAAMQWAAKDTPPVNLLGLVWSADQPSGRRPVPKPLREAHRLISGGVPRTWDIPWVDAWRTGDTADTKVTARLFADLGRLTDPR